MKKLITMILAVSLAATLLCGAALAEGETRSITVTGKATIQITPDIVVINIGVRETAPDVLTAQSNANQKINAIVAALTANGVAAEDIATSYISIYTEYRYDYQTGEQIFVGYTSDNTLAIKVRELDRAGALIDEALKAGANQLNGLTFTRENNAETVDRALTLAVQDAARKAKTIAAASDVNLGNVLTVNEEQNTYYYGGPELNRMVEYEAAADMGSSTELQGGMLDVSMTVTVTYAID